MGAPRRSRGRREARGGAPFNYKPFNFAAYNLRHRVVGQIKDLLGDLEVDALDDLERGIAGLGNVGEEFAHLARALHVKLIGEELHPARVGDGFSRADTQQHVVRLRVAAGEIVRVVGRHDGQVQFARDRDQTVVDDLFFRHAVAHDLDVEPVAEDIAELFRRFERRRTIVLEQGRRDEARHAAREHDQAGMMLREQIHVDARLVVVALEKAFGDQRGEILVAFFVGREQRDVRFVAHRAIEPAARRDIGLAADDRREPMLLRTIVKFDRTEHDAVIGERHARHPGVGTRAAQRIDAASAVQQRVFTVNVEVNERRRISRHGRSTISGRGVRRACAGRKEGR